MIDISKITGRQKLTIAKGLCDYCYIMDNWKKNDDDFKDVFYNFYLKARWSIMNKPENRIPYFDKLKSIKQTDNIMDILEDLKKEMYSHSYEFSIASKLLHTRNPQNPIYDSKVRNYLSKEEGVVFCWKHSDDSIKEKQDIKHDWNELKLWYDNILSSKRGEEWIKWFDTNFPNYKNISNIKKIDFIIFATR